MAQAARWCSARGTEGALRTRAPGSGLSYRHTVTRDPGRTRKPRPQSPPAGRPCEAALKASKVDYQHFVYEGAEHGFNNDTTPRYDEAAAKLAWSRTVGFFKAKLA